MWDWLSNIWTGISDSVVGQAAGEVYDTVVDSYVRQGVKGDYDFVTGKESYGILKVSEFDNYNYAKNSR